MTFERKVWLAVSLLPLVWKRMHEVPCRARGCGEPAIWVNATLSRSGRESVAGDRFRADTFHRTSAWCAPHFETRERRAPFPRVSTAPEAYAIIAEAAAEYAAWCAATAAGHREREVAAMARDGRILRASGRAGRLYERADGAYEVDLDEGGARATTRVCCARRGSWLLDSRSGGQRLGSPDAHDDGCGAARAGTEASHA